MIRKFHALGKLDIKDIDIQLPAGCDLGIQLAQRPGGSITGVGKEGFTLGLLPGVQRLKAALRHEHFTPDDEPCRGTLQRHGDGRNGLEVLRYILTDHAVTTGRATDKNTVFVLQRHRQTVDLRLHGKCGIGVDLKGFHEKFPQFFGRKYILQAHQRHGMFHFFKLAQCLTAHTLGGRIRHGKLRIRCFQHFQLPQKVVIFKVRHGGIIQHIIPVICVIEKLRQLQNSLFSFHCILRFERKYRAPAQR